MADSGPSIVHDASCDLLILLRGDGRNLSFHWFDDEDTIRAALLPPLPSGRHIFLRTLPADGGGSLGTGGRVWHSAQAMCHWLHQRLPAGARVLELGSGTGAVGIFCAGLGASHVALTDEREELLALAAHNWRRNAGLVAHATCDVQVGRLEPPRLEATPIVRLGCPWAPKPTVSPSPKLQFNLKG